MSLILLDSIIKINKKYPQTLLQEFVYKLINRKVEILLPILILIHVVNLTMNQIINKSFNDIITFLIIKA